MKVSQKGNMLTIEIEMDAEPSLSESGKTFIVASTHGAQSAGIKVGEMPLVLNFNAYYKNKDFKK